MKSYFNFFPMVRTLCLFAAGLLLPLLLTQCKSTGGSYQDIEYDPSTLKTPSGHGMEKKEYPFDDEGKYRKEWVRNKSTGKTRSASKLPENEIASTNLSPPSTGSSAGYYGPADAGEVASNEAMEVAAVSPSVPAPVSANYHKVVSGDTLYSLSQRYGTSVDALKNANGLTSNNIRTGQSLRLP
ncbi:MAG: LysM peptidoglycan-binding domain-containing protein [Verrucomicrobiales bacterium]|nr:LysM peptidoglycan-binding domain-containing protein [Verrucomicrobiales bacterium]